MARDEFGALSKKIKKNWSISTEKRQRLVRVEDSRTDTTGIDRDRDRDRDRDIDTEKDIDTGSCCRMQTHT